MRQIALLVEGQTEWALANQVLTPAAYSRNISLTPIIVVTSATPGGAHRGGGHWKHYDAKLRMLFKESHWYKVGLLLDYYGCPQGTPGRNTASDGSSSEKQHAMVEAISHEYAEPRFYPLVVLHEIEALVLAAIDAGHGEELIPAQGLTTLRRAIHEAGGPEQVNDGPGTSPSKRLEQADPNYLKTVTGPRLVAAAGLTAILDRCPVFTAWWTELLS